MALVILSLYRKLKKTLGATTLVIMACSAVVIVIFYSVHSTNLNKVQRAVQMAEVAKQEEAATYKERLNRVQTTCKTHSPGFLDKVYLVGSSTAYCPVPKIGSTFWKQVYLFLNNDTGIYHPKSPFDIPRSFVHYGKKTKTIILEMKTNVSTVDLSTYSNFMFVRDPFSRLWSAYLDKFYLPDFWRTFALRIIKSRAFASPDALRCGHDVGFKEFIEYVVSLPWEKMNEHWRPVKYICDPCIYKPDFIGKQETFERDARHVLKNIGNEWIIDNFDRNAQTEKELSMLIDYNFRLAASGKHFYVNCTNAADVGRRLWRVFQLNGYLPIEVPAESVIEKLTKRMFDRDLFKEYVLETFRNLSPKVREQCRLQKRKAVNGAYRQLPVSLVKQLIHIYADDFQSYGYDTHIPGT